MRNRTFFTIGATLALACSLPIGAAAADQQAGARGGAQRSRSTMPSRDVQRDRLTDRDRDHLHAQDTIYGSQLMTPAERNTYRTTMRNLKTEQEREAFRTQHHEEMQKRAQARGVQLPDTPPAQGAGKGIRPAENAAPATLQQRTREQDQSRTREQTRDEEQTRDRNDGNSSH